MWVELLAGRQRVLGRSSGRGDREDLPEERAAGHRHARVEDGTPIIVVKKDDATPKVEIVDDTKPAPQLLPASAPVVDLPAGPEPGDVLRVNTDFGVVHVLVPEGVGEGARLELGGVVEVAVPPIIDVPATSSGWLCRTEPLCPWRSWRRRTSALLFPWRFPSWCSSFVPCVCVILIAYCHSYGV